MQLSIYNLQFTIFGSKKRKLKFEQGQSLFELVVAIAISALIIVALVSLTTNTIQNSTFSKNKARAATYAQQASEWLRGQRDSDINAFVNHTVTPYWCLDTLAWTKPAVNPVTDCTGKIPDTFFARWASFNVTVEAGKNVIESDVVVSWRDSGGIHTVSNGTNLTDWRQR